MSADQLYVFQILHLPFAPVYLRCAAATRSSMVAINMALELVFAVDIALTFHTAVVVEANRYASASRIVRSHQAGISAVGNNRARDTVAWE